MSRLLLNIITPCTQTDNLELQHDSIVAAKGDLPIDIKWYTVFDSLKLDKLPLIRSDEIMVIPGYEGKEESVVGNAQVNWALSHIQEGFIHILKEDNLLHPGILSHFCQEALINASLGGLLVEQYLEDDEIRPIKAIPSFIDCAQFIVNTSLLEDNDRFLIGFTDSDGIFIQKIYNKHQDKFKEINKPLAYLKKVDEYRLLEKAPDTFGIGSLVKVNHDYFENHFSKLTNYMLFGTIFKVKRQYYRKLLITNIMAEEGVCLVTILPPRQSNIAWRHGKGTVIKFENREQAEKIFTLVTSTSNPPPTR